MMPLADAFGRDDIAYLAPQATGNTGYPYSFLSPIEANEPGLSAALSVLAGLVERLGQDGFSPERLGLLGFSQGASLSTEFAARNARRYGCVVGLPAAHRAAPHDAR
jgi:predicted esterase